jgi:hypothetical protein
MKYWWLERNKPEPQLCSSVAYLDLVILFIALYFPILVPHQVTIRRGARLSLVAAIHSFPK